MATLDAINEALDEISTQVGQLADQIALLQADTVTQEQIDAVAEKARGIAASVDAVIEPDAGEEPPAG